MSIVVENVQAPSKVFKDSVLGMGFSAFLNGWDISLNYLYHYQDQAVLFQSLNNLSITITPTYERSHLFGSSLSNVFGATTVRAEVGYSTDRFYLTGSRMIAMASFVPMNSLMSWALITKVGVIGLLVLNYFNL